MRNIPAPRQDLTFAQLKIYYQERGLELTNRFAQSIELLTPDGQYNYIAYLLADENGVSIKSAKSTAAREANFIQILTYYILGKWIIEVQQGGKNRAKYGKNVLKILSEPLVTKFVDEKSQPLVTILDADIPFKLSWTHYLILMRIQDQDERDFYEELAVRENWGKRELSRQYGSSLYERLLIGKNKQQIMKLSRKGRQIERAEDLLKDPYVLEFLGIPERADFSETELESRLIDHLQEFLLELGTGFTFVARQKRFTFDEDHFRVDLVFYNRLLRCFVLIDLKTEKLKHQDLGQMQMYVNYFDRYEKK